MNNIFQPNSIVSLSSFDVGISLLNISNLEQLLRRVEVELLLHHFIVLVTIKSKWDATINDHKSFIN